MNNPNLTFNILTFKHPHEILTFWFTDHEKENLCRIYHTLVPDEVRDNFGEQEHYYTSFEQQLDGFFPVTKNTTPDFETLTNKDGVEYRKMVKNSAFTRSVLKRYYNRQIHKYFKSLGFLLKPNFIEDTEIWLPKTNSDSMYNYYEKFILRVQIARVTRKPELLISSKRVSKIFKKSEEFLLNRFKIR